MKRARKVLLGSLIALVLIYLILIVVAYLPWETTPVEALTGKDSQEEITKFFLRKSET